MDTKRNSLLIRPASISTFVLSTAGIAFTPALLPTAWTGLAATAWACASQPDGSYLCSGTSAGETLSNWSDPLTVHADSTFTSVNGSGDGLRLEDAGDGIHFTQEGGSHITGNSGIYSSKHGSNPGSQYFSLDGDISATTDAAVWVSNNGAANDVTIEQTAGTLSGASHGIRVDNWATGSTTITTAGTITQSRTDSHDTYGIYAYHGTSATDITLTQTDGDISAHYYGMFANNWGTGSTEINSAGNVTATGRSALAAFNNTPTTDLRITQSAGTVTGNESGIYASNAGSGTTSVAVAGVVRGGFAAGISTISDNDVTIDVAPTADVSASSGIAIQHFGTGNVLVNSHGTVTGDTVLSSGNDTINLTAGSHTGNILSNAGDDTFVWTDGTLTGGFYGGVGSDTAFVSAAAYDGTQVLDGGDDTSVSDGMRDTLHLLGVSASSTGSNLVNWELVNLDNSALAITDGAWKVGEAGESDTGVFLNNGATFNAMNSLAFDGRFHIDNSSTFIAQGGGSGVYSISGDLNHAGTLNLQDGRAGDVLSIGQH